VRYAVHMTARADGDIDAAVGWIGHHSSPAAASSWHAGLIKAARSLERDPMRCPLADEATDVGLELRE